MIINLVNKDHSDVGYHFSNFPDGQVLPTLENSHELEGKIVTIKSRLSWLDIQRVIGIVKALREAKVLEIHLYSPYFLGGRSDRKFEDGSINYLKDVMCPIINLLKLNSITIVDPHSDALEMGLENFRKVDNEFLVKWALEDLEANIDKISFIAPDAGAGKKIYSLAKKLGVKNVVTCSKDRDVLTGEINAVYIGHTVDFKRGDVIIIDDICDGGWTFIQLAEKIKLMNPGRMILITTHGIYSKGFETLNKYFDVIYSTNSVLDVVDQPKLKQLNIF